MKTVKVTHHAGEYSIYVGENILSSALRAALEGRGYDRIFLVTDSNVQKYWGADFSAHLSDAGYSLAGEFTFKAGEESKRLATVSDMYAAFAGASLTRKSLVIALGGGVCGDMAGFAAATYLRGIDVMQVPTTLLSQIDSSIGGKTGVDLEIGKNLVGAFHQPIAVIADSKYLDTLPKRYLNDGMGEAIKYGCIADSELFYGIADGSIDRAEMIYRCMKIKAEVVTEDEFEHGRRAILNFGHTIGHAVEKLGNFKTFSHGEAVGIGMLYAARVGARMGSGSVVEDEIRSALKFHGLPIHADYSASDILSVVASDKKRRGDDINFVLIGSVPGSADVVKIPLTKLAELI